jgi:hypothetical protein
VSVDEGIAALALSKVVIAFKRRPHTVLGLPPLENISA